jgi:hypothetical protein
MRRHLALVALAILAATACVSQDPPGVKTSSVQTDITFDASKPKVGPLQPTAGQTGDVTVQPLYPSDFQNKVPDRFKGVSFGLNPQQASADCPVAPIGSAPETAASENASAPPPAGQFRYKRSGTTEQTISGTKVSSAVSGFEAHVIRNVQKSSSTVWTFDELLPTNGGVRVLSWSVNTDPLERGASAPYVGTNPVRAGEPGRGIALTEERDFDGNGNEVSSFTPVTPVLYMPLAIQQGESFTGFGLDPKSGQSLRVDGQTVQRQTVDACGTLRDGWLVKATVTESGAGAAYTHTDEYVFSTDLGGLMLSRHIKGSFPTGAGTETDDITYSIAQTSPTPDPGGGT